MGLHYLNDWHSKMVWDSDYNRRLCMSDIDHCLSGTVINYFTCGICPFVKRMRDVLCWTFICYWLGELITIYIVWKQIYYNDGRQKACKEETFKSGIQAVYYCTVQQLVTGLFLWKYGHPSGNIWISSICGLFDMEVYLMFEQRFKLS